MNWYTKVIEDRLDAQQKTMLQGFHEPSCVTVPLLNSRRQTCVMPNGALRQYSSSDGYSESLDGGLSWRFRKLKKSEIEPNLACIRQTLGLPDTVELIPFSAQTKQGVEEVWAVIEALWNGEL